MTYVSRATKADIKRFERYARRGAIGPEAILPLADVFASMRHATVVLGPGYGPLEAIADAAPVYVDNWIRSRYR